MMWRICETCAHSAWRDGKTAVTEVCLICTFGKDGQPTKWKEKSMTNADRIRAMSDMQLAEFLEMIISERDKVISESLQEQGVSHSLISMPALSILHHLRFLQRPAEDVFDSEED